ncbi:MAG: hypothetical protein QM780_06510 [Hyphomicrobium sp.]|uniref:hypothetical protein n=1 Tax=Hyphomicrobium sp. TaxID=82 RepID=UPI0039E3C4B3
MTAGGSEVSANCRRGKSPSSLRRYVPRRGLRQIFNGLLRRLDAIFGKPQSSIGTGSENVMKASEYLEACHENAIDAYTVEDAIFWHNEIISELSVELNLIGATRWPQTVKENMAAALQERRSQHAAAVTRLAAILERNERLSWSP